MNEMNIQLLRFVVSCWSATDICTKDHGNCANPCGAAHIGQCCQCDMSPIGPTKICSCCRVVRKY